MKHADPDRMKRVHFLCTGNYYRSRFAEILFNHEARRRGLAWVADSSGLDPDPLNPGPISRHTREALAERGIECESARRLPRTTSADDFQEADLVIAVKRAEHEPMIAANFPERLARVEFWDVHDLDCAGPDKAIPRLQALVFGLLDKLAQSA
jgi:protein-tyrosine phosphatase